MLTETYNQCKLHKHMLAITTCNETCLLNLEKNCLQQKCYTSFAHGLQLIKLYLRLSHTKLQLQN